MREFAVMEGQTRLSEETDNARGRSPVRLAAPCLLRTKTSGITNYEKPTSNAHDDFDGRFQCKRLETRIEKHI